MLNLDNTFEQKNEIAKVVEEKLEKVAEAEEKTTGGLLLTEATKEKPSIGTLKPNLDKEKDPMAGIMDLMKEDEQIEYIKERVSEEGRQEDMKKGKPLEQIVLDQAAFLLDLASIEGTWTDFLEQIAECYKEAGLDEIAKFVLYRDP
ncbi:hypothetical protein H6P81_007248 [Aristolochia fimbriata]|uniref:Uncharacterized protein n=1 Tax=Aristolochia fimbriata TaxID=158543 RepID=A0AAV7F0Y8_ARIFI|nr:hypothetical protein H6P81_007248 [Aristolochia fimbriata]